MGLLFGMGVRIINFMIFFLIVILLPGLPPRTTFPYKAFQVVPPKELKGALELNQHLDGAERLLEGLVYGPECLIGRKNEIYTGLHGGEVIKITADHVTHVAKFGQPCEGIYEEDLCGRPLGLAFDTQGNNLIVADAYYGIWEVNLTTKEKKLLVSPDQEQPGKDGINRKAKFFNYVVVDQKGDIYWTDSTSDVKLPDLLYTAFVNPSGRLFKYDRANNVSRVLLDELFIANGLALSPEEDFIVVAETGALRLLKYHLKGPKAGQSEVFVDGLPGVTDNLTPDADGIWVPLPIAVDREHPSVFIMFSNFPNIRLFLARLLNLFELPFRLINNVYPNKLTKQFEHFIGHCESITFLTPKRATIVRLDWNGNIVGSLHGSDKTAGHVSQVLEYNDYLYLGSPFNRFLARVKTPRAAAGKLPEVKVRNVRYEGVGLEASVKPRPTTTSKPKAAASTKPQTTTTTTKPKTQKPITTTTTPKPTTTTTTTKKPSTTTTTTTKKPATTTSKPSTAKPSITTPTPAAAAPKSKTTGTPPTTTTAAPGTHRVPPKNPAPIKEEIPNDTKPPKYDKLRVITKNGEHIEL